MSAKLNARQTVELLVLVGMLSALVRSVRQGLAEHGVELDECIALLGQALLEPLAEVQPDQHRKLSRRAERATLRAMTTLATGQSSYAIQFFAVARLIVSLTEGGAIAVVDGSAFDQAWTLLLQRGFGHVTHEGEAAAEELSERVWTVLRSDGYFA